MIKLVLLMWFLSQSVSAGELLITGVVESSQTQQVLMPLVRTFNGKISDMVDEGSFVEPGDFVIRIDGSELDNTIESLTEQLDVFKATAERDRIQFKIDRNNAFVAYEKTKVDHQVAKVKANVPVNFIGELEYRQRQLELKKSKKTLDDNKNKFDEVLKQQQEKNQELELGLQQKQNKLAYWQQRLKTLTIYAKQPGFIIYSSQPWTGSKYQVGDQIQTGMEIMKISKNEGMQLISWVNAIDVAKISLEKQVVVQFDALPGVTVVGMISKISSGGHDKKDWGSGLYYEVLVTLEDSDKHPLLSGMSAMI
ncbi:MAG: HlyD family secretion protein, partial [Proteobacteria bacterium]|nr:HlyD family secretion protein [Pseudomonadota bacterium]